MFPPLERLHPRPIDGLVALGGDLHPDTLVEAYTKSLFPWDGRQPIPWYSPDPRLILEPSGFRASASLRKLDRQRKLIVRLDTRFREVMAHCAVVPRRGQSGSWITRSMIDGYGALHDAGIAHSVEAWTPEGDLVGGLYGLALGRAFFGESMFALRPDASKLALFHLCRRLAAAGYHFVDCQQDTPHLRSLGAFTIRRGEYLDRLRHALAEPDGWADALAAEPLPG
jgi:leucyl/phenylalanyl-tRNA--protein transferase